MKYLLLAALLRCAAVAQAQASPAVPALAPYRYCSLVVDDRRFSFPGDLQLDYGQAAPGAVADPEMAEMASNISKSHSIIDVLNYLSRHGWELLNVNTVQAKASTSSLNSSSTYIESETHYLLRRRTP
ncbi:MAG: hypothetical protein ACRYFX_10935 [Janthinobacterium lividum]